MTDDAIPALRVAFRPGAMTCLWSINPAAIETFGENPAVDSLGLPDDLVEWLLHLMAEADAQDTDPDEARIAAQAIQAALGSGFRISV